MFLMLFLASMESAPIAPEHIDVFGKRASWLESKETASEGTVNKEKLAERPILRPAEVLESVPGMITTQHSGSGKANQYFLRGFNLDHGTDFATFVDGIPTNMPTHGHGQGYNDLNFLIPETLDSLDYAKGPYSVKYGDFSNAGGANLHTSDRYDHALAKYTLGSYGYNRMLILDSIELGTNSVLSFAIDGTRYRGPWTDVHENLEKAISQVKFVRATEHSKFKLALNTYSGHWNSTNEVPKRAVDSGMITETGAIDRDNGGKTHRLSLSMIYEARIVDMDWELLIYGVDYGLNLWSDPTYFVNDPVNGDQFEQYDKRSVLGGKLHVAKKLEIAGLNHIIRAGLQQRSDNIYNVGLASTQRRQRLATKALNRVQESSTGIFLEDELQWASFFRTVIGVRHDLVTFTNRDKLLAQEAEKSAAITSPKASVVFEPVKGLSFFANAGQSFHSNDARGVAVVANSGLTPAPALVPARGYELGGSWEPNDLIRSSIAFWQMKLDSELLFIGDSGTTEPSRASLRQGIDWMMEYAPRTFFHTDLEVSKAEAKYTIDPDGEGKLVEGALPLVVAWGAGSQLNQEWSLSGRLRHFGKRHLTADDKHRSKDSSVVNLRAAYQPDSWEFALDALNALDSKDHDIDYYFKSQLPGETEPVADLHFHPEEPRSFRLSAGRRF